jgi:hypothetical protein
MLKNGTNIGSNILVDITADHASVPFIYGIMINCAKTWDGTQRERRDSLLNCLSLMDLQIMSHLKDMERP